MFMRFLTWMQLDLLRLKLWHVSPFSFNIKTVIQNLRWRPLPYNNNNKIHRQSHPPDWIWQCIKFRLIVYVTGMRFGFLYEFQQSNTYLIHTVVHRNRRMRTDTVSQWPVKDFTRLHIKWQHITCCKPEICGAFGQRWCCWCYLLTSTCLSASEHPLHLD